MAKKNPLLLKTEQVPVTKVAWSNTLKQEVLKRFKNAKNAQFRRLMAGESGGIFKDLDDFLTKVESSSPSGAKQKVDMLWLVGQFANFNPPQWVPDEDEYKIKPLMAEYRKAVTKGQIDANIESFATLELLEQAMEKIKSPEAKIKTPTEKSGSDEEEQALGVASTKRSYLVPAEKELIEKEAPVFAKDGEWEARMIPRNPSAAQSDAMVLLCNNGIMGTAWCVGRGTTSYFESGPFYVLMHGGVSKYAISANSEGITLWNSNDKTIWSSEKSGATTDTAFKNLQTTAQKIGADLNMSQVSALPLEVIPLLAITRTKDPLLEKHIPESQLTHFDPTELRKAIQATPLEGLMKDLKSAADSARTSGVAATVCREMINLHLDLESVYSEFSENSLIIYLESLAALGAPLPESLEEAIVSNLEAQNKN